MSRLLFPCLRPVLMLAAAASLALSPCAHAYVDDAHSMTMEMATPYVEKGFKVRQDYWKGEIKSGATKSVKAQLFKGNEYWFWMGTDQKAAQISVHIYDSAGNLAEVEAWQKPHFAAARIVPKKTGSYYLIVEVEKSPDERTYWSLAYGFK